MAEAFEWVLTVRLEQVQETRVELTVFSAELLAALPEAASVVVLAQGQSVQVLNGDGEAVDLAELPFGVVERACALFGPGRYRVVREGQAPCRVVGRKPG